MASLALVGILVFTQTRGFLLTLLKIFRAWSSIASSNSVVLWLAHLMGMYFVSSFVLMRMNLSPQHRYDCLPGCLERVIVVIIVSRHGQQHTDHDSFLSATGSTKCWATFSSTCSTGTLT